MDKIKVKIDIRDEDTKEEAIDKMIQGLKKLGIHFIIESKERD